MFFYTIFYSFTHEPSNCQDSGDELPSTPTAAWTDTGAKGTTTSRRRLKETAPGVSAMEMGAILKIPHTTGTRKKVKSVYFGLRPESLSLLTILTSRNGKFFILISIWFFFLLELSKTDAQLADIFVRLVYFLDWQFMGWKEGEVWSVWWKISFPWCWWIDSGMSIWLNRGSPPFHAHFGGQNGPWNLLESLWVTCLMLVVAENFRSNQVWGWWTSWWCSATMPLNSTFDLQLAPLESPFIVLVPRKKENNNAFGVWTWRLYKDGGWQLIVVSSAHLEEMGGTISQHYCI